MKWSFHYGRNVMSPPLWKNWNDLSPFKLKWNELSIPASRDDPYFFFVCWCQTNLLHWSVKFGCSGIVLSSIQYNWIVLVSITLFFLGSIPILFIGSIPTILLSSKPRLCLDTMYLHCLRQCSLYLYCFRKYSCNVFRQYTCIVLGSIPVFLLGSVPILF